MSNVSFKPLSVFAFQKYIELKWPPQYLRQPWQVSVLLVCLFCKRQINFTGPSTGATPGQLETL
jgi:hypothetical protein